jgi:hypothetical protein
VGEGCHGVMTVEQCRSVTLLTAALELFVTARPVLHSSELQETVNQVYKRLCKICGEVFVHVCGELFAELLINVISIFLEANMPNASKPQSVPVSLIRHPLNQFFQLSVVSSFLTAFHFPHASPYFHVVDDW